MSNTKQKRRSRSANPLPKVEVRQEDITYIRGGALRLAFDPAAIRRHFADDARVAALSDAQLLKVGYHLMFNDDLFYIQWRGCLGSAVNRVAGFNPDDID